MELKANEIYTVEETTGILKISDSTFRRLVKKGLLRAAKIGGQYRVLGKEILYLLSPELEEKASQVYQRVRHNLKRKLGG
ncbi:MAG: helix-turn-helix domain-containing protein [Candidatus Saganbacteria bacterium]|nr:helix-turn-helix domain-containing protein [Candidatus Saganbacteria bacterium]